MSLGADVENMISFFVKLFKHSPIYPHWLGYYKMQKANDVILRNIHGDVIEVGAGDGARKQEFLKQYQNIKSYTATDYSTWDSEFEQMNNKVSKYRGASGVFLGYKQRIQLDKVCSATELPFENNSFDYHLSFEVLEHINDPLRYFSEASRVLRPGGVLILSVPFLYRMHGGEPDHPLDFFRYANGFFYMAAEKNNLKVVKIYANTGFGTTCASLTNQWIIRRIFESNSITKTIFFLLSPFVFLLSNSIGAIIDLIPDTRFATRFHVIMQKK